MAERALRPGNTDRDDTNMSAKDTDTSNTGRVVYDSRGNAFWQLATASVEHALETTTIVLRKLTQAQLAVADAQQTRARLRGYDTHGGYSPYDRVGRRV